MQAINSAPDLQNWARVTKIEPSVEQGGCSIGKRRGFTWAVGP